MRKCVLHAAEPRFSASEMEDNNDDNNLQHRLLCSKEHQSTMQLQPPKHHATAPNKCNIVDINATIVDHDHVNATTVNINAEGFMVFVNPLVSQNG